MPGLLLLRKRSFGAAGASKFCCIEYRTMAGATARAVGAAEIEPPARCRQRRSAHPLPMTRFSPILEHRANKIGAKQDQLEPNQLGLGQLGLGQLKQRQFRQGHVRQGHVKQGRLTQSEPEQSVDKQPGGRAPASSNR